MTTNIVIKECASWAFKIVIAVLVVFLVRTFLFQLCIVDGSSMEPTLHNKDLMIVNKTLPITDFKRGDIIIIRGNESYSIPEKVFYVKRLIGLPGDEIEIKDDKVFINNVELQEPYLVKSIQDSNLSLMENLDSMIIPNNSYFVMGDNRRNSMDSRNGLGLIPYSRLLGKTVISYTPLIEFPTLASNTSN